jgi:hypothetical protein
MLLTTKQKNAIKNAIAKEFDPYHCPTFKGKPDPKAWQGADTATRNSLRLIVLQIQKILLS